MDPDDPRPTFLVVLSQLSTADIARSGSLAANAAIADRLVENADQSKCLSANSTR